MSLNCFFPSFGHKKSLAAGWEMGSLHDKCSFDVTLCTAFLLPSPFPGMWKWGKGCIAQLGWTTQWAMPVVHLDLQLLVKYTTKCVTIKTSYANREVWKMRGGFLSQRSGIGQRGDRSIQNAAARAVNFYFKPSIKSQEAYQRLGSRVDKGHVGKHKGIFFLS